MGTIVDPTTEKMVRTFTCDVFKQPSMVDGMRLYNDEPTDIQTVEFCRAAILAINHIPLSTGVYRIKCWIMESGRKLIYIGHVSSLDNTRSVNNPVGGIPSIGNIILNDDILIDSRYNLEGTLSEEILHLFDGICQHTVEDNPDGI